MGNIKDKTYVSKYPPKSVDSLWYNGKEFKIFNNGKWNTIGGGSSSGGGSGSGVSIVDSVDKLDPNAKVGTLCSVATEGGIKEYTFRQILEISPEMPSSITEEDMIAYIKKCPVVNKFNIDVPKNNLTGIQAMLGFLSLPEGADLQSATMILLSIQEQGCIAQIITSSSNGQLPIFLWDESTQTYTKNEDAIITINNMLSSDVFYFCVDLMSAYLGPMSEETISIINNIMYLYTEVKSETEVYVKRENWEKVTQTDIDKINDDLSKKLNITGIQLFGLIDDQMAEPNILYSCYLDDDPTIKLNYSSSDSKYSEFMFFLPNSPTGDLTFTDKNGNPLEISWANGNYPILKDNHKYIIVILNGILGVFVEFS